MGAANEGERLRAIAAMLRRLAKYWLERENAVREMFVHEDDWGQIEVLPAACRAWCAREFARIGDFAAAHTAGADGGWTDLYVRVEAPEKLASLKLSFAEMIANLAERLVPFDVVASGSFSAPGPVPRVAAFGPQAGVGVIVVPDTSGTIVDAMTLIFNGDEASCQEVVDAVMASAPSVPLIIVDWNACTLLPAT